MQQFVLARELESSMALSDHCASFAAAYAEAGVEELDFDYVWQK